MSDGNLAENSINVITAIGSPDKEALISRALFGAGHDIRHRALTFADLARFMENIDLTSQRWVIVASEDLVGFDDRTLHQWQSESVSCVVLDATIAVTSADEIISIVTTQLRSPLVHRPTMRTRKLIPAIGITGTCGSPGRSTIAINLANEISDQKRVTLIDADSINPSLDLLLGLPGRSWQNEPSKTITPHLTITSDPEFSPDVLERDRLSVVDCGALGDISELRTDRRRKGAIQAQWLESCATLIYIARADELSLRQLEYFVAQRRHLPTRQELIFVLNFVGNSRRYRELEKKFRTSVPGAKFVIPTDYATMERVTSLHSTLREIAPRSRLRKSLSEIVRHLAS